jgi:hypothetical protein
MGVVSFMPQSLTHHPHSREKSPVHYPLNRKLGRLQSQSRCFGEMIKLLYLPAFKPQNIQPRV